MQRIALLMAVLLVLSAGGTYLYMSGSPLLAPLKPVLAAGVRLAKAKLRPQRAAEKKADAGTAGSATTGGKTATAGSAAGDQTTATALAEIQRKSDELAAREKALNEKEAQILLEGQRLAQDQEAFLKAKVSMAKLAALYEAMKPSEASVIIGQLPERQAANLLALIDEQRAGKIMALFDKGLAVRLTVMLAGN